MDPEAVAAYYRGKGYVVRDNARVSGPSGGEHKVPVLAEGPLGSLAVFFGDFGGVDGPEMGGARKVAREIGATPVLAADEFSNQDRQVAARLGVVLLDAATMSGEGTPTPPGLGADTGRAWPGLAPIPTRRGKAPDEEAHPWPASGRVGGRDGPEARAVDVDEILARPAAAPPAAPTPPEPTTHEGPSLEGLWKRPRSREAPAPRVPRTPGSQRFGWLGSDVPPAQAPSGQLAVEYDDVVPAKVGEAYDERLGEAIELQPTLEEMDHRMRRDRLLRRLFWVLFGAVVFYLLYVFLTP